MYLPGYSDVSSTDAPAASPGGAGGVAVGTAALAPGKRAALADQIHKQVLHLFIADPMYTNICTPT